MAEMTLRGAPAAAATKPNLEGGLNPVTVLFFLAVLAVRLLFGANSLYADVSNTGVRVTTWVPFMLLGMALFVALGFEFVSGFHDTANAVATVICTHALPPSHGISEPGTRAARF